MQPSGSASNLLCRPGCSSVPSYSSGRLQACWHMQQQLGLIVWQRGQCFLMDFGSRLGGVVLIGAGLYQLSPLKHLCLAKCRSPLAFIMTSWRDGYGGAFSM